MDRQSLKEARLQIAHSMGTIRGRASHAEEYEQIVDLLEQHIIPESYPELEDISFSEHQLGWDAQIYSEVIIQNCGYALLAYEWIRPLAQWIGARKCLEIMAGSGALSYALSKCGVDIIATDDKSWSNPSCNWFSSQWTEVERMDCLQAIQKYGKDRPIIICSWPYVDDNAYHSLLKMRKVNSNAVMIFIGEIGRGTTANDNFFHAMNTVEDESFYTAVQNFKQMPGLHDFPVLVK